MRGLRIAYLLLGIVAGILLCVGAQVWWSRSADPTDGGCEKIVTTKASPNDKWRATLTTRDCGWAFELDANSSTIRIVRLGKNGWFEDFRLETDQPVSPRPTFRWKGPDELEVIVKSSELAGSLERDEDGLRFIRTYDKTH